MRYSAAELRSFLRRLDGEPADAIESNTLECKPWDPDPRQVKTQLKDIREAVVCFANAGGGTILLGIQDKKRMRKEAITGVPNLTADNLRKNVYDGTDPHILVDVAELVEPEGRLLVIHVPQGLGAHTTAEGVAKIRVGKDCQPLTGSMLSKLLITAGSTDRTGQVVPGAGVADLDPEHIKQLGRVFATEGRKPELAQLPPEEMLQNVGLVRDGEVTLAAILLLGRSPALARWAPQHEVVFLRYRSRTRYDVRHNLKGPILFLLDRLQMLLEAHLRISTVEAEGFAELVSADVTWWSAREAVLNALVHRDYFLQQSVYFELRPGRVEITSPGGFIGGVTPDNILRHAPVRRNPLLADVLESAGYVNRAGMGVDRIYEELLRLGKAMPKYEADEATVRLILPTSTHEPFARFVADETREGRTLDLDDLILLRAIAECGILDRWSASRYLQCSEDDGAEQLVLLRERGYLVPRGRGRGTSYQLSRSFSDLVRGKLATDETMFFDDEAVRLRVQTILAERGRLTNEEVRRISGYSRSESLRLMRSLREDGLVDLRGRGRAAHYIPGPGLRGRSKDLKQGAKKRSKK